MRSQEDAANIKANVNFLLDTMGKIGMVIGWLCLTLLCPPIGIALWLIVVGVQYAKSEFRKP